ncbi:MAG: ABC transporter substrate-binding protein [Candidatus Bathyarchaeia archaeon]|nr:ABC transporter substrate-binding protein [Candidatus Bathyarchaeia archaeon]
MSNKLSGISRTIAAIVIIIIIVVAGVAAYIYYASTQPKPTLTVYALWSGTEQYNFKQVLGNFTENTGINVTYVSQTTQNMLITVPQQLSAPPYDVDVIIAPWPDWIKSNSAYLTSVTDLVTESQFPTNIIQSVTVDGTLWATPFKLSGKPGFWYRPSFFEANGLSVPTTYDEFKNTLLPAIQAVPGVEAAIASGIDAQGLGWPLSDVTEAWIIGRGGYQLQLDLETGPSVRNWTDSQVTSVFDELTGLLEAGYFSAPAEWTGQIGKLWAGKYGLFFEGNFVTAQSQVENQSDIDFFPFPGTNGVSGAVDYAVLTKDAPHLNEAKQLIQYLAGADAQEILVRQGGALATNTGVPSAAYSTTDKKVVDFMGQAGITIVPDLDDTIGGQWQQTFWDQLKLLWTDPSTSTMNSVLNNLQQAAITQQGT